MLLQAITIDDRAYQVEKAGKSFANTYVFPGGCLPSMEIIARSLARVTDMQQVHLEDITAHYAHHARALARALPRPRAERLSELGYDERFRRRGSSTCATAREAFASGASRTCSCCWRSPATAPTPHR